MQTGTLGLPLASLYRRSMKAVPGYAPGRTWPAGSDNNLNYHRLTFFARDNAFNIGWHENPRREIYSRTPEPHWFKR